MMIGVISDTHVSCAAEKLPPAIIARFRSEKVGLILHAGDIGDVSVLHALSEVAVVRAVAGNADTVPVREKLPAKLVEEVDGVRIGLVHGNGPPMRLGERLLPLFEGDNIRVLVYGHAHMPVNTEHEGVLLFNPGCPFVNRDGSRGTFGLLIVHDGNVRGEIIEVT